MKATVTDGFISATRFEIERPGAFGAEADGEGETGVAAAVDMPEMYPPRKASWGGWAQRLVRLLPTTPELAGPSAFWYAQGESFAHSGL